MAKRKTQEQFEQEVLTIGKGEYLLKSKYIGSNKKVILFHIKCQQEWEVLANSFLMGTKCCNCFGVKKMSHFEFVNKITDLHGDEYRILNSYSGTRSDVIVEHITCKKTFIVQGLSLLRGSKCPHCNDISRNKKLSEDEFNQRLKENNNADFTLLETYINCNIKLLFRHEPCGYEWKIDPSCLLHRKNYGCPNCSALSKGEKLINDFLKLHRIKHTTQYTLSDCKNINLLRFDFCVYSDIENTIKCLIEFDGKQHYEPVEFFGGEEYFEYIKKNDSIKNSYCKENNIKLIRIPYWELDNIESILTNVLM